MKLFLLLSVFFLPLSLLGAAPVDEKGFEKSMKELGEIARRSRATQENKDAAQMEKDAAALVRIYESTLSFWKERKAEDAIKWTEESSAAAKKVHAAMKAGNWEDVRANFQGVMKNCKSCHEVHREKLDDGSYRLKVK